MYSQVKSKMKRGFIACLLMSGLVGAVHGVDDNVESETQESGTNINFRFLDKNKTTATKITSTDNPSFNHLTASNAAATSSAGYKPSTVSSNPTAPLRYPHNQQYYQPNPYVTYVQIPQAAQIAAQYSFQSNPVAHFLQTPTQIQYVATPTIAQVPQIKHQSLSTGTSTVSEAASSATDSQYGAQSQQTGQVPAPVAPAAASGVKQVQAPLFSDYQSLYYTQQPVFTYFPQPQATNYIYQHPTANYLLRQQQQQQQQQLASIYEPHRFGLYTPNAQLTYLVPVVVPQVEQDPRTTTTTNTAANVKSSDKTLSNARQQTSYTNSFSFGTKA